MDSVMLMVGGIIGSGIFLTAGQIATAVHKPLFFLGVWIVGGLISLLACFAFAEMAAMYPEAGGQYVFLREAYGEFPAFLYGWMIFTVGQSGTIAALAVGFAEYFGAILPFAVGAQASRDVSRLDADARPPRLHRCDRSAHRHQRPGPEARLGADQRRDLGQVRRHRHLRSARPRHRQRLVVELRGQSAARSASIAVARDLRLRRRVDRRVLGLRRMGLRHLGFRRDQESAASSAARSAAGDSAGRRRSTSASTSFICMRCRSRGSRTKPQSRKQRR